MKELQEALKNYYHPYDPSIFKIIEGEIHITVSSSMLKAMFYKDEKREFCPMHFWWCDILRRCPRTGSESMNKGVYFETKILGSGADGKQLLDLPRHKRTGEKLTDQIRIDELVDMWDHFAEEHKILVIKDGPDKNTQLRFKTELDIPELKEKYPTLHLHLKMDTDLISPIFFDNIFYPGACIDLKLTQSLTNTFGEYAWGEPHRIDHIQAFLYSFFLHLPFFYAVGEYREPKYKIFPVNTDQNSEYEAIANEAKTRYRETIRKIIDFVDEVMEKHERGWWYYQWPSKDECNKCPFNSQCKSSQQFKTI